MLVMGPEHNGVTLSGIVLKFPSDAQDLGVFMLSQPPVYHLVNAEYM